MTHLSTRTTRLAAFAVAMTMLAAAGSAAAQAHPEHVHADLPLDASLTLAGTVDAMLANYPDSPTLDARSREAEAWRQRGESWLSGRPSLMLRYQTDHFGANLNLEEFEAGVELPLWSWGGRQAVRGFGDALTAEAAAAVSALRWQAAGLVRIALWRIAAAENDHELAQQALTRSERLLRLVERRHELGDVAQRDVLLANASHLELQTALIEANAALVDAEREFRSVTGIDRRPDFVAETLSDRHDIADDHPALTFAHAALTRAQADVERTEKAANSGPSVLVGTRRERPAMGTELDDSVGVTVSIPFGGDVHRQPQITAAARVAATARAELQQQRRALTRALHEAAHGLDVTRKNLQVASERLDLAERHRRMGKVAYETGELALTELLRMQATEIEARRQVTQLMLDRKRQIAAYNQAVGVLP